MNEKIGAKQKRQQEYTEMLCLRTERERELNRKSASSAKAALLFKLR